MATAEFTPTADSNRFAFEFLEYELDTLMCLSIALQNVIRHSDPNNIADKLDTTESRLSETLSERLTNSTFLNQMRVLLLGKELEAQAARGSVCLADKREAVTE